MSTPAEQLQGLRLENGWVVGGPIPRTGAQTGGHFSCSYGVTNVDGTCAFLKAMDYTAALSAPDPATALNELTSAFLFEREVLEECADRRMSRIVRAIDGGRASAGGSTVEYLIFEEAKGGDIRKYLDCAPQFDLVWTLTCLHNICVGVRQLNGASIAHQDLKPSNVLHFPGEGQKLADLGRAWHKSRFSPHDALLFAGDWGYAPPELLYRYASPDESDRRFGADFYLVGSMVLFLFSGLRASEMLILALSPEHQPSAYRGTYEEVLPYLHHAFCVNLEEIGGWFPDAGLGKEVVDVVSQMCDPNLSTRGDRSHTAKFGSRFSLERFISRFDRLRMAAMLGRIRHP
ncbi:MAG TPA: protein kinase [Terracidiphilus sp.]|jgi:serine/threonine protein kinase|nr:protein kinase [Terracidiphilus sp.]